MPKIILARLSHLCSFVCPLCIFGPFPFGEPLFITFFFQIFNKICKFIYCKASLYTLKKILFIVCFEKKKILLDFRSAKFP